MSHCLLSNSHGDTVRGTWRALHPLSLHNNYNDHNDQLQPSDMWLSMLEECDSAQPNLPSQLLVSS